MKCLAVIRGPQGKGWLNCDRRTHYAASRTRPGWAYELRFCPECYERILDAPCPPPLRRGDAINYQPLDIRSAPAWHSPQDEPPPMTEARVRAAFVDMLGRGQAPA